MPRIFMLLSCLFALGGCMSMPLTSMYKLSQVNPLEANPEDIRVAIRAADVVMIEQGMVTMNIAYHAEDESFEFDHNYEVEVIHNDLLSKVLLDGKLPGEQITIMHMSAQDAAQMRQWQRQVREHKQAGGKGTGMFTIGMSNTCLKSPLQEDELEIDIFIQIDSEDGYFVMFDDMDLLDMEGAEEFTEMKLCSEIDAKKP